MSDPSDRLDLSTVSLAFAGIARAGDVIADHVLIETLGSGRQGTVWLALDGAGERVALKVLHEPLAPGSPAFERFHELNERVRDCVHPNVVRVLEHGDSPFGPWIAQELVPGGRNLHDLLEEQRRLDVVDRSWYGSVAKLVESVARGLSELHRVGVLHGDVKPSNVLLTQTGEPKIGDLGLARSVRQVSTASRADSFVGTIAYAAPELVLGPAQAGVRCDVYSLGVMLYELCTLQRPIAGHHAVDVVRGFLRGAVRPPQAFSSTPEPLGRIAMRCLERTPKDRYASCEEVADELARYSSGREPLTSRWHLCRRLARRAREEWRNALLVTTTVAVVGLAAMLHRSRVIEEAQRRLFELEQDFAGTDLDPYWPNFEFLERCVESWSGTDNERAQRLIYHSFVAVPGRPPRWGVIRCHGELARAAELVRGPERASWMGVLDRLARDERFDGYALAVEEDLVPLGVDPETGLETFWHQLSGSRPDFGPNGRVLPSAATGIVLVLLPPGRFDRGVAANDAALRATPAERVAELSRDWKQYALFLDGDNPPTEVTVGPCYVSMFELTQGQWRRMTGGNPSIFRADAGARFLGHGDIEVVFDDRHPVENVSALEAESVLLRFGFALPSETLFEYAARAGTAVATRWPTGDDPEDPRLPETINCQDEAMMRFHPTRVRQGSMAEFDDGFAFHAPVGSTRPNAFGLHEMLGNVAEVCADDFDSSAHPLDDRPHVKPSGTTRRSLRGGHYNAPLRECAVFDRDNCDEAGGSPHIGVRPVRWPRARVNDV
jgi:formylglycine-generating enzyme required for sulfatase activity